MVSIHPFIVGDYLSLLCEAPKLRCFINIVNAISNHPFFTLQEYVLLAYK